MNVTQGMIGSGLRRLGLKAGDAVMLHSSLSSFGSVRGGAKTVVKAFLEVLGAQGTLVVPTFGRLGVIPDCVRDWPGAVRSVHPLAGVAAVGAGAAALCRDHWKARLAHGPDTPYMRLVEADGYVCLAGVDLDRCTLLHTAEELLGLPYLQRTKPVTFDTPEGPVTASWPLFPGPHRDFIALDRLLRREAGMQVARIGGSVVRLVRARALLETALAAGREDPAFALCDNPGCADCVTQRAALRQKRFKGLTCTVAAAASLAGRHPAVILEQCAAAGVAAVELDALQGRPLTALDPATVRQAVRDLRKGGLAVTALRLPAATARTEELAGLARACRVPKLVLPLSERAADDARAAGRHGVTVSFVNHCHDSAAASAVLEGLKARRVRAGFVFNAAAFARAGEHPFLGSYKARLRRFVDQLDVEDGLADGTPRPLMEGQAEIKEMVSILLAGGFAGTLVLAGGNRAHGGLADAVARFERLLDGL